MTTESTTDVTGAPPVRSSAWLDRHLYHSQDGIRIFCGDNRQLAPMLGEYDLLHTDPPYGIGRDGQKQTTGGNGGRKAYQFMGWDADRPGRAAFDRLLGSVSHAVIWGGNYYDLPPASQWLVWDKGQRICNSDGELAFSSFDRALRVVEMNRVELLKEGTIHPTQKPVKLYQWLLANYAVPGQRILEQLEDAVVQRRAPDVQVVARRLEVQPEGRGIGGGHQRAVPSARSQV